MADVLAFVQRLRSNRFSHSAHNVSLGAVWNPSVYGSGLHKVLLFGRCPPISSCADQTIKKRHRHTDSNGAALRGRDAAYVDSNDANLAPLRLLALEGTGRDDYNLFMYSFLTETLGSAYTDRCAVVPQQ